MSQRRPTPVTAPWIAVAILAGCVSAPVQDPPARTRVETGPPPAGAVAPGSASASELPALPVGEVERRLDGRPRIESLEAVNEDIRTVLRGVADRYGLEYRLDPAVQGRVTARLRDASLTEALDALILPYGYTYALQGDVLRVEPAGVESRLFGLDFIALSRVGVGTTVIQRRLGTGLRGTGTGQVFGGTGVPGGGGVSGGGADVISSVEVTDLWEDIRVALEALIFAEVRTATQAGLQQTQATNLAGGLGGRAPQTTSRAAEDGRRLIVNPSAGTILVSAPPATLEEVEAYLAAVESAIQRQVRIEAKFVEVLLDREYEFGIDWGGVQRFGDLAIERTPSGSGGIEFTLSTGAGTVSAVLDALETQGNVRVLSSPGVSTLNNQRAVFNVTTEEVFVAITTVPTVDAAGRVTTTSNVEVQPVAVGIVMDVLPQISADNTITMNVRPMVTSLTRVEEFEEEGVIARAPVVDRRELDTVVRVRSGETHVIGGLIQNRIERVHSGVPILKDIPLLGRLFSSVREVERKGELVIFITPTVIAGSVPVER